MKLSRWFVFLVGAGLVAGPSARMCSADSGTNVPALAATNAPVALPPAPPPILPPKSPVDSFRELLAMKIRERQQFLANRPEKVRERLLAKVREYAALKPDERELRLRATELRWYLVPLMSMPATNRAAQLEHVPAELREAAENRLQQWDLLPPPLQQELLENDRTLRRYLQLESSTPAQKEEILSTIPPGQREELEAGYRRWLALPESERKIMLKRLDQFFELTPNEKTKVLSTLSEPERRQMEETLRTFENLPPAERARCIRSFGKFVSLSLEERRQFLKNAERWQSMTPAERQEWRNLVSQVPLWPPEPPDPTFPPPLPPLVPSSTTNRH